MIALMVSVARFFVVLQALLSLMVLALVAGTYYANGASGLQQMLIFAGGAFLLLVFSGFSAVLFQINDRLGVLIDVTKEAGNGSGAAAPVQAAPARRTSEPSLRASRD